MPPAQPAQFTMPTIEARYAKGPPTRGAQDLGSRLSSEEHEYIIMRLRRGVSHAHARRLTRGHVALPTHIVAAPPPITLRARF